MEKEASRYNARPQQEQQKLEGVQQDFDVLKGELDQARRSKQDAELKQSQTEAKLQEELEALKQQQRASNEAQTTVQQERAAKAKEVKAVKDMLADSANMPFTAFECARSRSEALQVQVQLETATAASKCPVRAGCQADELVCFGSQLAPGTLKPMLAEAQRNA